MRSVPCLRALAGLAFALILAPTQPALAAAPAASAGAAAAPAATYADLADLADSAELVVRAQVRKVSRLDNDRARVVRAGWGRFYIQARTQALLTGEAPQGEALTYLVDLPLDARGKPPGLKKRDVLLFARPVKGRPGELQLVAPDAQLAWSAPAEAQLRAILGELVAADAPGRVTGVRELIHVQGTLAGEGETQIFLATEDGSAASITVQHKPGAAPLWGVSFSELLGAMGNAPRRDSLAWYRLACFLPHALPAAVNLSETPAGRTQAQADYRMVLGQLGECARSRS